MRTQNFLAGHRRQSGQVMLFLVLALSTFLIGAMALAIDLSNLWFRRQSAQTAADAACTAGAMDLLSDQNFSKTNYGHITAGTDVHCNTTAPNTDSSGTSHPSPCVYAYLNGYNSSRSTTDIGNGLIGNNVSVIWSTTGAAAPPGVSSTPYMEVDVSENVPTFFAGLLRGRTSQTIKAISKCGIELAAVPIPLIVLDPLNPDSKTSAFDIGGTPTVKIYGGPLQSIQVNSADQTAQGAVTINGSALVDLSQGGPNTTGSSFGVVGYPISPLACSGTAPNYTKGFCDGTTGSWMSPHSAILDPLRGLSPPSSTDTSFWVAGSTIYPGVSVGGGKFAFLSDGSNGIPGNNFATSADGSNGCSAHSSGTCVEFKPGKYPNGICLGSSCPGASSAQHAIFQEGLYYLGADLKLLDDSCVRMSPNTGPSPYNGWGGATFYFYNSTGTLNVSSNAGGSTGCDTTQTFTANSGGPTGLGVFCDSTAMSNAPTNVSNAGGSGWLVLTGNVLLAPCKLEYGDQNYNATAGRQRGILFYQDRANTSVSSTMGGGGTYAMAGTFYFHSCQTDDTQSSCTYPTGSFSSSGSYFLDTLTLSGGSGASSYILGEIITDNLVMSGSPTIYMDLSPSTVNNIYKAALYQ